MTTPRKPTTRKAPDKSLWGHLSRAEQQSYIANLRQTADDVDAGVGSVASSWAKAPKVEQRAFAKALRAQADKLERETPGTK
jgi:hypothetical protein